MAASLLALQLKTSQDRFVQSPSFWVEAFLGLELWWEKSFPRQNFHSVFDSWSADKKTCFGKHTDGGKTKWSLSLSVSLSLSLSLSQTHAHKHTHTLSSLSHAHPHNLSLPNTNTHTHSFSLSLEIMSHEPTKRSYKPSDLYHNGTNTYQGPDHHGRVNMVLQLPYSFIVGINVP